VRYFLEKLRWITVMVRTAMGLAGRKSFLREQRYIREQRVQIMAFDAVLHDRNEKKKNKENTIGS